MTLPESVAGGDTSHLSHHDALHTAYNPSLDDNLIRYVTKFGSATNDGMSFATAFDDPQDAFNTVPAGGEVRISPGIYQTTVGFTLDTEHVRIVGAGGPSFDEGAPHKATQLKGNSTGIVVFEVNEGGTKWEHGPLIENIHFSWNIAPGTGDNLVHIHNANRWLLRRCSFRFGDIGLLLTGPADNAWGRVDDCSFRNLTTGIKAESASFLMTGGNMNGCSEHSIHLDNGSQHCRLIGIKLDDRGMLIRGAENHVIGCAFENKNSPMVEIEDDGGATRGKHNQIIGCSFIGNSPEFPTGIRIGPGAVNNSVIACNFHVQVGIEIVDLGTDTLILSNEPDNRLHLGSATMLAGSATPEAAIVADIGSMFMRDDGALGTSLYTKTADAPVASQGTLTMDTIPADTNTMTVDGKTYTFQTSLTDVDGNVAIGGSLAQAKLNIVAAFNRSGVAGTDYADSMLRHTSVSMATFISNDSVLTAEVVGPGGDLIATTETFTPAGNIFDDTTLGTTTAGSGDTGWLGVNGIDTQTNAGRPAANSVPTGYEIFNTDDGFPNWSDGTNWVDATGSVT